MRDVPKFETELQVAANGAIATIHLNRPDEGNILSRDMMFRLSAIVSELAARPETRVIVLAGRGAFFCKGRDGKGEVRKGVSALDMRVNAMAAVLGVYDAIAAAPVPVIARVHGNAIGFGLALATGCDITLVSDAARFAFSEIEHGIAPTMAMSAAMKSLSPKALSYLIYSAAEIDAQQAVNCNLASVAYPKGKFDEMADAFITKLAAKPRIILETIKKYQDRAIGMSADMRSEYAGTLMAVVRSSTTD